MTGEGRALWVRPAALMMILAALGAFALLVNPLDPSGLLRFVNSGGRVSFAVFVGFYAVCTLSALPRNVLSTVAGAMFGLSWGLPLAYLGSLIGAAVAFWLARLLGREAVGNLTGARGSAFDDALVRRGFWAVMGARLTPFVPFTVFNYLAGVTGLSWRTYSWGTIAGILPGTILYVVIGTYALAPRLWSAEVLAGALLLGAAYVVARSLATKRRSRSRLTLAEMVRQHLEPGTALDDLSKGSSVAVGGQ